jgi:hypothetical protein
LGGVASIARNVASSRTDAAALEMASKLLDSGMASPQISEEVERRAFQAYFLALGNFNHAFTRLESTLTCCIKNTLKREMRDDGDEWVINAVVGGLRIGAAKAIIQRLLRTFGATKDHQLLLQAIFAQSGHIEWLRNRIAHNATLLRGTDEKHFFVNVDFASAAEPEKSEYVGFQPGVIRCATQDLIAITRAVDDLFSMLQTLIPMQNIELPSWQYKPAMLVRHRPKLIGNRKRYSSPPPTSQV